MSTTAIAGREEELSTIRRFLEELAAGPAALVISGEPGIGKTVLWEIACDDARRHPGWLLSWRGVEAEAMFAFAGLSELLTGVLDGVAPTLARPRRRALEVALLLAEPDGQAPDAHAIGLALLDVLGELCQTGPVLVALDDVQWLDASSAAVLQVAMRRLRQQPVGVLMTLRDEPGSRLPFELERSFSAPGITRVSLSALERGAFKQLFRQRLEPELSPSDLALLHEASGGNPFFALELARFGAHLERRSRLRVPETLGVLLGERLARLPGEIGDVVFTVAVAGRPTIDLIGAVVGSVDAVGDALDVAVRERVLVLEGERVRFAHPLLASICYQQAPAQKRRATHRLLADAVADVEERARHLALAAEGPDAIAVTELDAAADHAAARGATAAGADLSELAASLTASNDAPASRRRRLRAANLHRLAGNLERAVTLLEELLAELPCGIERADVLLELATTRRDDLPRMVALCDEALAAAADDAVRCTRILAYRSWAYLFEAEIDAALRDARAALRAAEHVGDPTLMTIAIAQVATVETRAADITPGLLERGLELEAGLGILLEYNESPRVALARRLIGTAELDRARAVLEELENEAAAWGGEELRGVLLRSLGRVDWLAGRWEAALERTALALEFWDQMQAPHGVAFTACLRALLEVDLGRVDEARASAERAVAISRELSDQEWEILSLGALGRLELALGNLTSAGKYMKDLPGRLLALGYQDPTAPVWADTVEVLLGLGELEQARTYLDRHEDCARRVGSPLALACVARCRGLLAGAEGDLDAAFDGLERAVTELAALPYPLEYGRALLCLGSVYRKAKRKGAARDALERSQTIFNELGARLWSEKATVELRRISGRRRGSTSLTETEERVARLAAIGRSNKQIAAELLMSVHTVGAHLSHVYRKLGISSRSELASNLSGVVAATESASRND
jgi:DNA-binding CsgD family transcriptional regulator